MSGVCGLRWPSNYDTTNQPKVYLMWPIIANRNMVSSIHATVDDDVNEHIQQVKEDYDLTWPEFMEEAAKALEKQGTEE